MSRAETMERVAGSATAMMGGLMIWGLIASLYLSNIIAVVLVLATVPPFASILHIFFGIIGPAIIVVCLIGAYMVAMPSSTR